MQVQRSQSAVDDLFVVPPADKWDDQFYTGPFCRMLQKEYLEEIEDILLDRRDSKNYALTVDFKDVVECDVFFLVMLRNYPLKLLPLFDEAAHAASEEIWKTHVLKDSMTVKKNLHVRLGYISEQLRTARLPQSIDSGRLVALRATVVRTGARKMLEYKREFMCGNCGEIFFVHSDYEQMNSIPRPTKCSGNNEGKPCTATKFTDMVLEAGGGSPAYCSDYQEIKVQEQISKLEMGVIPRSMYVSLEHDLVEKCKPGDDVTVVGVVMRRWKPVQLETKCDTELVLKGWQIEVNSGQSDTNNAVSELRRQIIDFYKANVHQPLVARNHVLRSFCPQIYGLYVVKLAVLMSVIGGVARTSPSGMRIRGQSHLLLVGDPGTGKSQFLKYCSKLVPRSIVTTGAGTSSAGLTVAAVKDGSEWSLEAGALVLADGGMCCIDEFASVRESDRATIHEAMEQQTISVAKAGLVCKLNTRATVLAATNPKGAYDEGADLSTNTAIASPLLSRFDVVLVLLDTPNREWDEFVSSHIFRGMMRAGLRTSSDDDESENTSSVTPVTVARHSIQQSQTRACNKKPQASANGATPHEPIWNLTKLSTFVALAKSLNPQLSRDAEKILIAYYQLQRQADFRNAARTTIRLLESMVRLAQAHARIMLREIVLQQDAVFAVLVMETGMQGTSFMSSINPLHSVFPDDPESQFLAQEMLVLERLDLEDQIPIMESYHQRQGPQVSSDPHFTVHPQNHKDVCNRSTQLPGVDVQQRTGCVTSQCNGSVSHNNSKRAEKEPMFVSESEADDDDGIRDSPYTLLRTDPNSESEVEGRIHSKNKHGQVRMGSGDGTNIESADMNTPSDVDERMDMIIKSRSDITSEDGGMSRRKINGSNGDTRVGSDRQSNSSCGTEISGESRSLTVDATNVSSDAIDFNHPDNNSNIDTHLETITNLDSFTNREDIQLRTQEKNLNDRSISDSHLGKDTDLSSITPSQKTEGSWRDSFRRTNKKRRNLCPTTNSRSHSPRTHPNSQTGSSMNPIDRVEIALTPLMSPHTQTQVHIRTDLIGNSKRKRTRTTTPSGSHISATEILSEIEQHHTQKPSSQRGTLVSDSQSSVVEHSTQGTPDVFVLKTRPLPSSSSGVLSKFSYVKKPEDNQLHVADDSTNTVANSRTNDGQNPTNSPSEIRSQSHAHSPLNPTETQSIHTHSQTNHSVHDTEDYGIVGISVGPSEPGLVSKEFVRGESVKVQPSQHKNLACNEKIKVGDEFSSQGPVLDGILQCPDVREVAHARRSISQSSGTRKPSMFASNDNILQDSDEDDAFS